MMLVELVVIITTLCSASSYTPHIIIITADDVGSNDFGFKGSSDARTPKIDEMYSEESSFRVLDNYYVMPNGHSTRSALLTAKHPAVLGTQFESTDPTTPYGINPEHTLLPEYLKELGYSTHAVGQWDLGFYSRDMLPTRNGYDTFYGQYLSNGDYLSHKAKDKDGVEGLDLHNNEDLVKGEDGMFKPELYYTKATKIIEDHDSTKPLHLYLALQSAQIDNYDVLCKSGSFRGQIPNDYTNPLSHVKDPIRRCYLALVFAVDQAFGAIVNALNNRLMLSNSVIIFTTTSGGPAAGHRNFNAASNSPYRGAKLSGWEGGVRGVGMIYSDLLDPKHRNSDCLFHVTDWIPTLLTLYKNAKRLTGDPLSRKAFEPMYGIDQYECVFNRGASHRYNVIHFVYGQTASVRKHKYKYIVNTDKKLDSTDEWYGNSDSSCGERELTCNPESNGCLFDVEQDPCEMRNIAPLPVNEGIIDSIKQTIAEFNKTVKYSPPTAPDGRGSPTNFDYSFQPWVESVNGASVHISHLLTLISSISLLVLRYTQS